MILIDPDLDLHPAPKLDSADPTSRSIPSARTLAQFLRKAQADAGLRGEVTVLLTTDAALRDLNRRFRGKDNATDVLSFPSTSPAPGPEKTAGDVAISVETARRQAAEQGHSLTCELKILILHGLLHLAGYDHESDPGRMHRRERALRAQLGLPLGLIERASGQGCPILSPASGRKGGRARTPRKKKIKPHTRGGRSARP